MRASLFVLLCICPIAFAVGQDHEVPNIVLLMADDLGWGDLQSFDPDSPIETPNLDAMSRSGLKFNRFYSGSSVCSPTRGSCLTGRHPYRYGVKTANVGHLLSREFCLAEVLKERGFTTGHFGKWHLGTLSKNYSGKGPGRNPELNFSTPAMNGFDEWFSTEFAVATWDPYDPLNSHLGRRPFDTRALFWQNGKNITEPLTGCTSKITMDRAIPFITNAVEKKQPFLSVIWFHAPHSPVVGGPEYLARYQDYPENERHYYAVVTAMDEQVGRLQRTLDDLGVAENTLIWFCSDNGPEGNPQPQARNRGSAGPFRGRKRSLYEGGVRVPGILVWPRIVREARTIDEPCVTSDFFPTLLAVVNDDHADNGIDNQDDPVRNSGPQEPAVIDGVNLMSLIRGEKFERPRPIGFQFGSQASWVERQYKLVHNAKSKRLNSDNGTVPTATFELYDLLADPFETKNIATLHPDRVVRMGQKLERWQASCRSEMQK